MHTFSRLIIKETSGQVLTGHSMVDAVYVIPGAASIGDCVLYKGTAATAGNEVFRARTAALTNAFSNGFRYEPFRMASPIRFDGGLFASLSGLSFIMLEMRD